MDTDMLLQTVQGITHNTMTVLSTTMMCNSASQLAPAACKYCAYFDTIQQQFVSKISTEDTIQHSSSRD